MTSEKMTVDTDGRWLLRVGGISALLIGAAYVITIVLFAYVGTPPSGGEAWLKYLAGKTTRWWAILSLSVLTDLLYIPVAASLYLALRHLSRNVMLIAAAFVGLFIVLDLAVTWANYASLISLSGSYAAAAADAQRESYVAAANYASAVLGTRLEVGYSIVSLSLAILVIGAVMLKGVFNKATAYLGLATGIVGIASLAGFGVTVIVNAVLATVWILLVGYRLFRLGQE